MDTRKIIRTNSAGVFFGEIISRAGKEAVIKNARRLWYWAGAASLSELATSGVLHPDKCKFPAAVDGDTVVTEVIEIIDTTPAARSSIDAVNPWSAK